MLFSKIPDIKADYDEVRSIAPSGFVMALNVRYGGPEYLHSEFPEKWKKIYEDRNYFIFDPMYYWTVMNTGATRWSQCGYPDPKSIGKKAAEYGLVYGATVCIKEERAKTFLSAARADRELTDSEIDRLKQLVSKWVAIVRERPVLSDAEMETLLCLRDGLEQAEIAKSLGISVSTVKQRFRKIRIKFNALTITEALSIATEKRYFNKL